MNMTRKNPDEKPALHLVPGKAILAVGEVITWSITKYPPETWRGVRNGVGVYVGAAIRHCYQHLAAVVEGRPPLDAESGLPHLAHAAVSALYALDHFLKENAADE